MSDFEDVLEGLRKSPLLTEVKNKAIKKVREISEHLTGRFESLSFAPPSTHREWYEEITREVMSHIAQTLIDNNVPIPVGRKVYYSVYQAVSS